MISPPSPHAEREEWWVVNAVNRGEGCIPLRLPLSPFLRFPLLSSLRALCVLAVMPWGGGATARAP